MGILSFLLGIKGRRGRNFVSSQAQENILKEWERIYQQIKGGTPSQLRQALISADKTVDTALKDLSTGDTMGERLKNAKDLFNDWSIYDKVWKAHKVRNNLVHESGYEPPHYVLTSAIEDLKKGLKKLGVDV